MSKRLAVLVVLASIAALVVGVSLAGAATSSKVKASLSGSKELGGGKGKGSFTGTFKNGKICYTLKISGVTSPVAAHIHKGAAGKDGNIVIDLLVKFKSGTSSKCVTAPAKVVSAIKKSPSAYYVNVHTKSKPAGTMRGQLSAA